jgi:L-threonylcarbamoyladenylate synthase
MNKCKDDLSKAVQVLRKGSLIVYPTDTLYALGADVFNDNAVKQVFNVKKRPFSIPLPVAVSDFDMLKDIVFADDRVKSLVDFFLPGPLTLILKKKDCVSNLVTSDSDKVAVRIPGNEVALKLLSDFGPLTVTSANVHGEKTPGIIKDVKMQFKQGDIAVYLDYGQLEGKASTIVDVTSKNIKIIREGVISKDMILDVI